MRVKDVFLLLAEHLNVVLGLLLFLLLNDLLQVLLLLDCRDFRDGNCSLGRLVFGSSLRLFVFVVGHIVVWFLILNEKEDALVICLKNIDKFTPTYSFNVNLEAVEGILGACANVLFVKFDSLLLEEVLDGGLSNLAVIDLSVVLDPPLHVFHGVVGPGDLILGQLSDTVD